MYLLFVRKCKKTFFSFLLVQTARGDLFVRIRIFQGVQNPDESGSFGDPKSNFNQ